MFFLCGSMMEMEHVCCCILVSTVGFSDNGSWRSSTHKIPCGHISLQVDHCKLTTADEVTAFVRLMLSQT